MKIVWNANKAMINLRKHRVDFADAATVLDDPMALTVEDNTQYEERWVTLGIDILGRVLVVVYTYRNDIIRIISARKATPHEHKQYEA